MSRIENWSNKYVPSAVAKVLTDSKKLMEAGFGASASRQAELYQLLTGYISGVTGATPPTAIQMGAYWAFTLQANAMADRFHGGGVLDQEFTELIAKWGSRGLASTVSTGLLLELFHWTAPAP